MAWLVASHFTITGDPFFGVFTFVSEDKRAVWEAIGLSMGQLQIRLLGPDLNSFSAHSHGYAPSNEFKSCHKRPNFRYGPDSPTAS